MKELREIKSRYDFTLDNRQVVLIISGLILVLMLSFLMGTLFGRNLVTMAEEDRQIAAAPRPETVESDVVTPENDKPVTNHTMERPAQSEEAADKDVTPSEREKLLRKLESMKVPSGIDPGKREMAPAPPAMASLDLAEDEDVDDDPEPAGPEMNDDLDDASEPVDKSPGKKTKSAPPRAPVPAGSFTIQLASLPERADAERLVNELRGKKYDAFMLQVTLPGKGTFFRVRVGHYVDLDQAKKALAILQKREGKYFDAWITQ